MQVKFIISQPIQKSKKFKLSEGQYIVIGRSNKAAQVVIIDELASNCHCKVSLVKGQILLEDLNSKNGVYLNGVRILNQRMFINDKVKIGESTLYIDNSDIDEETYELLSYSGTHMRSNGGFTLELDSSVLQASSPVNAVKKISTRIIQARRKAYAKKRANEQVIISKSKLTFLEHSAFIVDALLSVGIFLMGVGSFYLFNPSIIKKLEENYKGYTILFSNEMSTYTISSFIIMILFFSMNRRMKSGSIGEKLFKIN